MKKLFFILPIIILVGCSSNTPPPPTETTPPEKGVYSEVEKEFVGVAGLAMIKNSSVAVSESLRLTTKSNRSLVSGGYPHPTCDVLAFSGQSEAPQGVGVINLGESLFLTDDAKFTGFGSPLGRAGETFQKDGCTYRIVEGVIISGVKGSGVYNKDGDLVGISIGESFKENWPGSSTTQSRTVILELRSVKSWLEELK